MNPAYSNRGRKATHKFSQVESGIPIPPRCYVADQYPWRTMKVGQSFMVFCPSVERKRLFNSLTGCRYWAEKKSGWKYAMRATPKGIRVWRVA